MKLDLKKYTKNLLAGASVAIQFFTLLLLLVYRGSNSEADDLFIALSVVSVIQLLILLCFDQFVLYYNKIAQRSQSAGAKFYCNNLVLVMLVGSLTCLTAIGILSLLEVVISESPALSLLKRGVLVPFVLCTPAYSIISLNDRYFNAIGKITQSYFLLIIPSASLFLAVAYWCVTADSSLTEAGYIYSLTMWIAAVVTTSIIVRSTGFQYSGLSSEFKGFVWNSFWTRFGHNIYAVTFQLVSSFVLLNMGAGLVSLFNYCYRTVIAVSAVAAGPATRQYMYELSRLAAANRLFEYPKFSRAFIREAMAFYIIIILAICVVALSIYGAASPSYKLNIDIGHLLGVFSVIAAWQAIAIIESLFVGVVITSRRPTAFIVINTIFSLLYYFLSQYAASTMSLIYFAFAGLIAQLISLALYRQKSNSLMAQYKD